MEDWGGCVEAATSLVTGVGGWAFIDFLRTDPPPPSHPPLSEIVLIVSATPQLGLSRVVTMSHIEFKTFIEMYPGPVPCRLYDRLMSHVDFKK